MNQRLWTVARFPAGIWSTGGNPDDPEYEYCEVFQVLAKSRDEAKRKAQSMRSNAIRKKKAADAKASQPLHPAAPPQLAIEMQRNTNKAPTPTLRQQIVIYPRSDAIKRQAMRLARI